MKTQFDQKRYRRRDRASFNPNRDDIQEAMKSFTKKGGKIKKLKSLPKEHEELLNRYNSGRANNVFVTDAR